MDPNLGMPDDAVYVFCNMTAGGETCVFPDVHSSQMPNIPWRKEGENDWYSNLRGGFRVIYTILNILVFLVVYQIIGTNLNLYANLSRL